MMQKLRVLDLFSGIGGFSLGLERTGGFETVAFCEIEEFPRRVLAKHWPDVPCYRDVRELTAERLSADGIAVDVICGGFPCQDLSVAGRGAGLAGERSGLWHEFARLIGEIRPRFVIVENVAALLGRGMGVVLGDLAALGYDAEWHCIPAASVGAPHRRDRLWIVAYPQHGRVSLGRGDAIARKATRRPGGVHSDDPSRLPVEARAVVADANSAGRIEQRASIPIPAQLAALERGGWWRTEPQMGRVAHGVPDRVGQLKGYGNAVVPQIPEMIGRAILASLGQERIAA